MIHRISVSNYFSIRDEAVLDLRIPKTAPDLPRFRRSRARPDVRLPSVAVLMGPNGSGKTKLQLAWESTGTKHLFHLLPQLHRAFSHGAPVVLDDFDSRLHVDMASRILRHFQSPETNEKGAQLLAAAHNVGLLDDLEKEELFIVEKDESGATRVHGAQDVRGLRRVNRLYPKYRAGMLGGVPTFG